MYSIMARIFEGRIKWRVGGDYCENVFHWNNTDDGVNDFTVAARLYNAMIDATASPDAFISRLRLATSNQAFISTISARCIKPVGGNRFANQFLPTDFPGLVASPVYTDEIAMVINWLSVSEPAKMGRVFLPGVPTSFIDGGRWDSTAVTAADNFVLQYVDPLVNGGSTFVPCIYRVSDFTSREVSDGYLSPNVGQQSRRGMGE